MRKGTFAYRFLMTAFVWLFVCVCLFLPFFQLMDLEDWAKILIGVLIGVSLPLSVGVVELLHYLRDRKENHVHP